MQSELNFALTHTHSTDPETSAIAAENHLRSGKVKRNQQYVIRLVNQHIGFTTAELAQTKLASELNLDRAEIARRMSECVRDLKKVKKGDSRRCTVNHSPAKTWFPA